MAHFTRSGSSPWNVTVRDINLNEVEAANGYLSLRMDLRDSDVGQWTLRLPSTHPAVKYFVQPGSGIVVRPIGHTDAIMSGWTSEMFITESRDSEVGGATFVGFTDEVLLTELAYPDPSLDVSEAGLSTFATTHDVRSGPAETVLKEYVAENIGPAAGILRRRYQFLNIPASTDLGSIGTWTARFDSLLELCREIVTYGGLSFRIIQSAPGQLALVVYEPEERSEVRFSVKTGNLTTAVLTYRSPDSTEGIAGLSGEGAARTFTRRQANGIAGLVVDGVVGNFARTPDHASLDITGDIDLRVVATTGQWQDAVAGNKYLIAKWDAAGNQRSYAFRISTAGFLQLAYSTNGTAITSRSATAQLPISSGRLAVRVTFDVNDGGGNNVVRFYYSESIDGPWTQLGSNVTNAGTITMHSGSAVLEAGTADTGGFVGFIGTIQAAQVLNGIDGTIVADADFERQKAGVVLFNDSTGKPWTVDGDAYLTGPPPVIEDWGRRVAKFHDRRSDETLGQAQRAIDTVLIEDAITAGMQLYPIEQEGSLYGIDYRLGDKVPAVVQGVELIEPVRRVVITHEANRPVDIVPNVGLPLGDGEFPQDAPLIKSMLRNLTSVTRS